MNDAELLRTYTMRVIGDPFDTTVTAKLQQQIDKCQNQETHDRTVAPEMWERCKAVLRSAKVFVSDSRHMMRYQ